LRVEVSNKKKSLSENSQKGKKKKKRKKTGTGGTGRHENPVQNVKKNHREKKIDKK